MPRFGQGFAMAKLKVLLALVISMDLSRGYQHSPLLRLIVEPDHGVRLLLNKVA